MKLLPGDCFSRSRLVSETGRAKSTSEQRVGNSRSVSSESEKLRRSATGVGEPGDSGMLSGEDRGGEIPTTNWFTSRGFESRPNA